MSKIFNSIEELNTYFGTEIELPKNIPEDWFVEFFINNPISIDKTIKRERKYNWGNVPENIKWIATNEEGFAFGYESKPISGYLHYGFWYGGGESKLILWSDENQFNSSNWRHSLEWRD